MNNLDDLTLLNPFDYLIQTATRRKLSNTPSDQLIAVEIVHFESPSLFYVRLKYSFLEHIFDLLHTKLEAETSNNISQNDSVQLNVGDIAIFVDRKGTNDIKYLRCSIDRVIANAYGTIDSYNVTCIDYGSKYSIDPSEVIPVPDEIYKNIASFAFKCCLVNVQPNGPRGDWSATAKDVFESLVSDHKDDLYIWIKDIDNCVNGRAIEVNLVTKERIVTGPFSPIEYQYITFVDILTGRGLCMLKNLPSHGSNQSDSQILNEVTSSVDESSTKIKIEPVEPGETIPDNIQRMITLYNAENKPWFTLSMTQYTDPRSPDLTEFKALISEVSYDGRIYGRIVPVFGPRPILQVNDKIKKIVKFELGKLPEFDPSNYKNGMAVTAMYPDDGTWNRGRLLGTTEDESEFIVFFVDYGQTRNLPCQLISRACFCPEIPELAVPFELYEVKFSSDENTRRCVIDHLFEMLVDKVVTVKWENAYNTPLKINIELADDNEELIDLKKYLLSNGMAYFSPDEEVVPTKVIHVQDLLKKSSLARSCIAFRSNEFYRLQGALFCFNNFIFLQFRTSRKSNSDSEEERQISRSEDKFLDMMEEINRDSNEFKCLAPNVSFGTVCIAQSLADDRFYRGIVVDDKHSSWKDTFYPDYGNCERIHQSKIRELHKSFHKVPVHSFICCIENIRPKKGFDWSYVQKRQKQILADIDQKLIGKFDFKKIAGRSQMSVDLYEAENSDSKIPIRHAFSQLIEESVVEFIDPLRCLRYNSFTF